MVNRFAAGSRFLFLRGIETSPSFPEVNKLLSTRFAKIASVNHLVVKTKLKASSAINIKVYLSTTNICIMGYDYGNTFIGVIGLKT